MAKVVFTIGDDVSTDTIYPGRFMATVLPSETPQFAFADFPEINPRIKAGDLPADAVIVGGKNFGCGSSREQAASCLASVSWSPATSRASSCRTRSTSACAR
jgi:3-isopropylmalate/(R)-2-methylmalate dehydratase small subunit